jgi:LPXTG-site transpeptidase (sortase) family protein
MAVSAHAPPLAHPRWHVPARFVGNLLLGLALGLLSYNGVTYVSAGAAQSELRVELAELGPIADDVPAIVPVDVVEDEPELDFAGWDEEDAAYWDSLRPGDVFGRIVIPAIGVDKVVVYGTDLSLLKRGPGWLEWTDYPGPTGNAGISGHRTTYGAPFFSIDGLEAGDEIVLYSPYRRYTYHMTEQRIVLPHDVWVAATSEDPMITLTACHPLYSARNRIIVHGELYDVRRLERAERQEG